MLSFTGQGQLGKLGKLATFAYEKRKPQLSSQISKNQSYDLALLPLPTIVNCTNNKHNLDHECEVITSSMKNKQSGDMEKMKF